MKIIALVLSLFVGSAFACSCEDWSSFSGKKILASADQVFLGIALSERLGSMNDDVGTRNLRTTFLVDRSFKPRATGRTAIVRSYVDSGANCGTSFRRGGKYLILAYRQNGKLHTDGCSYDEASNEREFKQLLAKLAAASRR